MRRTASVHIAVVGGSERQLPLWPTNRTCVGHLGDRSALLPAVEVRRAGGRLLPAGGFRDREDYYQTCSTDSVLDKITIPTVVMTAHDDPFVKVEAYLRAKVSSSVTLHMEPFGGHMGYITRNKTPLGTLRWQDYAVDESLKYLLK